MRFESSSRVRLVAIGFGQYDSGKDYIFYNLNQCGMSDFKKIINYSAVSDVLTGSKNVIRINRPNASHSTAMNELYEFLSLWVEKNAKSKEVKVTIKTKK